MKGPDELLCLDGDVKVVERVDVGWMSGSDEPSRFDCDVESDSCCNNDIAGFTDVTKVH